jgi:hypothetical protein
VRLSFGYSTINNWVVWAIIFFMMLMSDGIAASTPPGDPNQIAAMSDEELSQAIESLGKGEYEKAQAEFASSLSASRGPKAYLPSVWQNKRRLPKNTSRNGERSWPWRTSFICFSGNGTDGLACPRMSKNMRSCKCI